MAELSDREMLELAARAAGYDPVRVTDDGVVLLRGVAVRFDSFNDCGDALRLAVAAQLEVYPDRSHVCVRGRGVEAVEDYERAGSMKATCRAITRAAAAQFLRATGGANG